MSWEVVGIVSKRQCGGAVRRVLLLTLAQYSHHDGTKIFASVPTLARDAEIDPRTVQRNIKALTEEGLLVYVGKRPCKNGYTNEYRLRMAAVKALPEIIRTEDLVEEEDPRQNAAPVGLAPVAGAEITPDTPPPPAECPPGAVPPDTRQPATQPCQGTLADAVAATRAMTREEFAEVSKRVLDACGPGLVDPSKSFVPIRKLAARLPVWLTRYDLELDIIAVLAEKTARPRTSPLHDPTIFEDDIAAHHAARMKPLPEPEKFNERAGQGQSGQRANGRGGMRAGAGGKHGASAYGAAWEGLFGGDQAEDDFPHGPEDGRVERVA